MNTKIIYEYTYNIYLSNQKIAFKTLHAKKCHIGMNFPQRNGHFALYFQLISNTVIKSEYRKKKQYRKYGRILTKRKNSYE